MSLNTVLMLIAVPFCRFNALTVLDALFNVVSVFSPCKRAKYVNWVASLVLNPNRCVKLVNVSKVCPEMSAANPNSALNSLNDWFSFLLVIKISPEVMACLSSSNEIPFAVPRVIPNAFCKFVIFSSACRSALTKNAPIAKAASCPPALKSITNFTDLPNSPGSLLAAATNLSVVVKFFSCSLFTSFNTVICCLI